MVEVSSEKWNCLLGNTINIIVALGHLPLLTSAKKDTILTQALSTTRLLDTQHVKLPTVSYALSAHGYNTAITRKGSLVFSFLQGKIGKIYTFLTCGQLNTTQKKIAVQIPQQECLLLIYTCHREIIQNLHVFILWPFKYHSKKQ
jgi:hypothetical protein